MSNGWKMGVLKRRRAFLAEEITRSLDHGVPRKSTKYDQREHDALDWAIETLEPLVPDAEQ